MESTLGYSEYDEAWFTEPTDSMASYYEKLQNDVELALNALMPFLSDISAIKTYRDLLLVDKELLALLEAFEMARIELNEGSDDGILARTSGHHKDYLAVYQDALARRCSPSSDYICLTNGRFSVSPFEILMIHHNG
jgi:hypothetical protein